ncbi:MAG: hypothetical protein JW943_09190 [Deltaproteobacteria bacterium]|nr:hypothetical protein [Deltaproteobacteria bacterium]
MDKIKSPDQKHVAELSFIGEIRFGPAYFSLAVDSAKIKHRIFGNHIQWSDDSRYLAAQEWLTTDERMGPVTRVVLIDVQLHQLTEFKTIDKGFAEDFIFRNNLLCYKIHCYEKEIIKEAAVEISSIKKWRKIT